jgi:predicted O-linked N-acetylglucosamine transferase (SPINDLY family)
MARKTRHYTNPFLKAKGPLAPPGGQPFVNIEDAIALHLQGQLGKAQSIYQQLLVVDPVNADALHLLGVIAYQTGQHQHAVDMIGMAIEINPHVPDYHSNRGNALQELQQFEVAVTSYDKAIKLNPEFAQAYINRGAALKELQHLEAAIASYEQAIRLQPGLAQAYSNRGIALKELHQLPAALASYDQAIALKPDYAEAYYNRSITLQELKQLDAAVASYDAAIALKPDYAEAYSNRGAALKDLKQIDAALASFDKAFDLSPDIEYLLGMRLHTKMFLCDWRDFETHILALREKIQSTMKATTCLSALALPLSMSEQHQVAKTWCSDKHPAKASLGPIARRSRQPKIRIGYYSADFHDHPVSILTVGLFEHHDRSKFELIAFSFGRDIQDEMRERITNAFDRFIDVRANSDEEVAVLSRALEVDIAIDLGGHTQDARTGIFSFRAAPVQLSYIGYLGTMGADYYDYLIADRTIIPIQSQAYYSEKIVYLPSYQVNDSKQEIPHTALNRQELNLPISGFVYCCFNANYKITPSTFDAWIRILKAVPESVLLLYTDIQSAAENLKLEAQKRGISPTRLVFGGKLIRSEYLSRCKSADLFLDTLPYNAGASASDALWAGLPVLTCMGESFASRVAASLLLAIGLPELVAQSQADYEALAIELATNPVKLKGIKDKLESNRMTTPLFDTALFAKHIEAAYTNMHERYQAHLPPDHMYIEP